MQCGARVQDVVEALRPHGLTLQNFASIREQQIGGFIQVCSDMVLGAWFTSHESLEYWWHDLSLRLLLLNLACDQLTVGARALPDGEYLLPA